MCIRDSLDTATEHRLLVVRRLAGTERRERWSARVLVSGERGVKYDLGPARRRPAHGFRVTPSFVADGDAEFDAVDLENLARCAGDVEPFFARVELVLRLNAEQLTVGVEDEGRDLAAGVGQVLHTCLLYTSDAADERSSVDLGG